MVSSEARLHLREGAGRRLLATPHTPGSEDFMVGPTGHHIAGVLCRWNPGPGRGGKWGLRTLRTQGLMLGPASCPEDMGIGKPAQPKVWPGRPRTRGSASDRPLPTPRAWQPYLSLTAKSFCCSRAWTKTMRKCLLLSSEEKRLIPSSMLGRQLSGICRSNWWWGVHRGPVPLAWPRSRHL